MRTLVLIFISVLSFCAILLPPAARQRPRWGIAALRAGRLWRLLQALLTLLPADFLISGIAVLITVLIFISVLSFYPPLKNICTPRCFLRNIFYLRNIQTDDGNSRQTLPQTFAHRPCLLPASIIIPVCQRAR